MSVQDFSTAQIGRDLLPQKCRNIPDFFLKKAESELFETPDRRAESLDQIKEFIKNDIATKQALFDDDFLIQYLRAKKYNASKAFACLKALVNLKKQYPDVFTGLSYEKIERTLTDGVFAVLPWRCQDGCTIFITDIDKWDPEKIRMLDIQRALNLCLFESLREPMTQINGFKVIINAKSNPVKHLKYCTPGNVYLLYHGSQECIPARYKEIHVVNQSIFFKAGWFLMKPLMSEKFKKRMHFHKSPELLLNFFPKAILPKNLGGDLENYDMTDWLQKAMEPEKLEQMAGRYIKT